MPRRPKHDQDPVYLIGRLAGIISVYMAANPVAGSAIPPGTMSLAATRPLAGLPALVSLIRVIGSPALDQAAETILCQIGADALPAGPLPIAAQGPYWVGYHHARHGALTDMTWADLERAGVTLYGEVWQSALANDLGVNPRRVREWGERYRAQVAEGAPSPSIPRWVRAEIYAQMRMLRDEADAEIEKLDATPHFPA